jgi:DNA-directed RNA polymerase beta subunit
MNTYNDTVIKGVIEYVKSILERISEKDYEGRVISLVSYDIVDEGDIQLSDIMKENGTLSYQLILKMSCLSKDGTTERSEYVLQIPRMINNVFVIEGKSRIATNLMVNDGECRIYPRNIVIDYNRRIRWSFPKGVTHSYEGEFFKVTTYDLDGNQIEFMGIPENYETYKDLLKLTEKQIWKLQIKLGRANIPEYLTYDLVGDLYNFGPDIRKDLIIDKRISTIEDDFIHYLYIGESKRKVIIGAQSFFKTGLVNFNALQSIINSYFKAAKSKCVEIPSSINPLIYDALKYKVVLPISTAYNATFTDLIDAPNTPENNNVNIINELNVCVSLEGSTIMYACYDFKTRKKVQIPYLQYLTKKVLKSEYFDYDTMEIKTSATYEYKQYLKEFEVPNLNQVQIDLIEPAPDDKLSYTTRRIPLINMSDSVRVAMGAAMIRQAIQTEGCEPRLVTTGNDDFDYASAHSLIRYQGINEGEVVNVTPQYVDIKDKKSGLIIKTEIPEPTTGLHNNLMTHDATVKVGDTVIPGQVIVSPTTMKDGSYNLGVNAKTVYMSYLGMTYEDGVVISESYAKKCTQYRSFEVICSIRRSDNVIGIIPIGSKVHSLDKLVDNIAPPRSSDSIGSILSAGRGSTVMKAIECSTQDASVLVPNNVDLGYVTDVKIIEKPSANLTESTKTTFKDYEGRSSHSEDYLDLPEKYQNLKSGPQHEWKEGEQAIIKITIVSVHPIRIGDKSSNSWGGKGEISLILPDDVMPRLDLDGEGNGPAFDIIMNPAAVVARKNPSQLYECLLTKIIQKIQLDALQLYKTEGIDAVKDFVADYYKDKRFDKVPEDKFESYINDIFNFKMKVGSFSKIDYDTILQWMNQLDVKEDDYVYCPDVVIYQAPYEPINKTQHNNGTAACSPEYAKEHGIKGKLYELGFVERPVVTGLSYMYKLHHSGMDTGKVTSELTRSGDPIMGRGLYRGEGQMIGEMELWALKSRGAERFVTDNNPDISRDENLFLAELMLTGLMITDQLGLPYGIPNRKAIARSWKEKYGKK